MNLPSASQAKRCILNRDQVGDSKCKISDFMKKILVKFMEAFSGIISELRMQELG